MLNLNEWQDEYWSKLIWRCADNNSYEGCALPERQEYADVVSEPEDCWNGDEGIDGSPWGEDIVQSEIPKYFADEAEWSDGWK